MPSVENLKKQEDREKGAARLRIAYSEYKKETGLGFVKIAKKFGWPEQAVNRFKRHTQLSSPNGFDQADGETYAQLFGVNIEWLMLGEGPMRGAPVSKDEIPAAIVNATADAIKAGVPENLLLEGVTAMGRAEITEIQTILDVLNSMRQRRTADRDDSQDSEPPQQE